MTKSHDIGVIGYLYNEHCESIRDLKNDIKRDETLKSCSVEVFCILNPGCSFPRLTDIIDFN